MCDERIMICTHKDFRLFVSSQASERSEALINLSVRVIKRTTPSVMSQGSDTPGVLADIAAAGWLFPDVRSTYRCDRRHIRRRLEAVTALRTVCSTSVQGASSRIRRGGPVCKPPAGAPSRRSQPGPCTLFRRKQMANEKTLSCTCEAHVSE